MKFTSCFALLWMITFATTSPLQKRASGSSGSEMLQQDIIKNNTCCKDQTQAQCTGKWSNMAQ